MRSSKRLALAIKLFDEVDHLFRKREKVAISDAIIGNKEAVGRSIDERIDAALHRASSLVKPRQRPSQMRRAE